MSIVAGSNPSIIKIWSQGGLMKPISRWIFPVLLLAMLGPGASVSARPAGRSADDPLASMLREGWKPVAPGVLQRQLEGDRVETFAIGPEGSRWAVREIEHRLALLKKEFQAYPNDNLRRAIRSLRRELSRFREDLETSQEEPLSNTMEKCAVNYGASADAFPLSSGAGANASAFFSSGCGYEAETYAYAYARANANGNINTVIQEAPRTGTNITGSATASVQGTSNCLSEAYSYARYSPANIFYSASDTNTDCIEPPAASIDGPSTVGFDPFSPPCSDENWSATISGGTPPYSYRWSVNGVQGNTVSGVTTPTISYSRTVCSSEEPGFILGLTVTDSGSQSATSSLEVWVVHWFM
jgi:hypothetical protein